MRNGYRERGPTAPVGGIAPRIPKLRAGTYIPEGLIERHSRADRSVAESWANVVSTRKMERIARKMGIGRLSKDQVNAMRRSLDAGSRNWSPGTPGRSGFPTCSWTPPTSSTGGTAGHSTRRSLPPSASPRRGVPHARRRDHRRHRRDVGTRRCVHRGGRGDVLTYLDFPMVPGGAYAPTTHRSANRGWSRSFRATSPCCAR